MLISHSFFGANASRAGWHSKRSWTEIGDRFSQRRRTPGIGYHYGVTGVYQVTAERACYIPGAQKTNFHNSSPIPRTNHRLTKTSENVAIERTQRAARGICGRAATWSRAHAPVTRTVVPLSLSLSLLRYSSLLQPFSRQIERCSRARFASALAGVSRLPGRWMNLRSSRSPVARKAALRRRPLWVAPPPRKQLDDDIIVTIIHSWRAKAQLSSE